MCTPKGSAFLWASDAWKDKITPLCVSWGPLANNVGDGFFINEQEFLGTRDYSMFLTIPLGLKWMKDNDWPFIQNRNRNLKKFVIDLLCKIDGVKPLLQEGSDPLTQLGAVLLPNQYNMIHMKDWLYDVKKIEVVVHKALGHNILRFSIHAHTSESDIFALEKGVRDYFAEF